MYNELITVLNNINIISIILSAVVSAVVAAYIDFRHMRKQYQSELNELVEQDKEKIVKIILEHNSCFEFSYSEISHLSKFIVIDGSPNEVLCHTELKKEYVRVILASVRRCRLNQFITQKQVNQYLKPYRKNSWIFESFMASTYVSLLLFQKKVL